MNTLNQKGETSLIQTVMVAALIIAAFFIGMLWTKVQVYEKGSTGAPTAAAPANPSEPEPPRKIEVAGVTDQDHVRGNRQARVALIEYSDLECPFCKQFHPTALQMVEEYGDKIMWVFRHFPLDQLHSRARNEAIASECAFKLGGEEKFWAFIDKVYEVSPTNNRLEPDQLPVIAGDVGVDVNGFNTCLTAKETAGKVSSDYQSGLSAGINGTPGNILLDTQTGTTFEIPGAVPYEELKQMIDNFMSGLQ